MSLKVDKKYWNDRMGKAYHYGTYQELLQIQGELLGLRQKLAEFIDRYLEEYDSEMSLAHGNHPTWKLFREKHEEYGEVEQLLRNVEYFLRR